MCAEEAFIEKYSISDEDISEVETILELWSHHNYLKYPTILIAVFDVLEHYGTTLGEVHTIFQDMEKEIDNEQ